MSVFDSIKKRPVTTGVVVLGGGVLLLMVLGGQRQPETAGGFTIAGPSDAAIQAGATIQAAQIQAQNQLSLLDKQAEYSLGFQTLENALEVRRIDAGYNLGYRQLLNEDAANSRSVAASVATNYVNNATQVASIFAEKSNTKRKPSTAYIQSVLQGLNFNWTGVLPTPTPGPVPQLGG